MPTNQPNMIMAMPHKGTPYPIEKLEAHVKGIRHHAISVFVISEGRMLIQQRATHKYHSGGLWANACCSHPVPGESALECATRRVKEELGADVSPEHVGTYDYRADVGEGLIEAEFVDLFTVHVKPEEFDMQLNADEVADTRWIPHEQLINALSQQPQQFTAWFQLYMTSNEPVMQRIRQQMGGR